MPRSVAIDVKPSYAIRVGVPVFREINGKNLVPGRPNLLQTGKYWQISGLIPVQDWAGNFLGALSGTI